MKSFQLVPAAALVCAALLIAAAMPAAAARAQKFSSAYTDLKTQCKPDAEEEVEGADTPLRCAGYGGYEISIGFSAASSHLRAERAGGPSGEGVELATQALHYDARRKIEWRMADGKPFALIFRVDKTKDGLEATEMWRPENKTGEALVVKGLKGYEHIDFEINARTPDANVKAREMADKAYAKGR